MKKIGIITFYRTYNYGSSLQGYALQHTLEKIGFDSELINYKNKIDKNITINLSLKFAKRVFLALIRRLFWSKYKIKIDLFENFFKKYIHESKIFYSTKEINLNEYDGFICGSDQIWTPTPYWFDTAYFLDFVDENIKKISYAPSIGTPKINFNKEDLIKEYINRIDFLSVRETQGADIIKMLTDRNAKVVLDPTFLISESEWGELAVNPDIKEPYIFCYFLGERKEVRNFTKKLKKISRLNIVNIPVLNRDLFWGDIRKIDAGPREFLGLIKNAEYVCSDSFHAIVFSIIFNKKFFALKRHEDNDIQNQNIRIIEILKKLNIYDRYVINNNYNISENLNMDFSCANKSLKYLINESIKYLVNSLS